MDDDADKINLSIDCSERCLQLTEVTHLEQRNNRQDYLENHNKILEKRCVYLL